MEAPCSASWRNACSDILHWMYRCTDVWEEILNVAFNGVSNMLLVKAWSKAVCGLRMMVVAVLETFINEGINISSGLQRILERACTSRTGRLWIDSILLCMRAEPDGNWLLHQYSLQRMVPYFFAAGHWTYARYIQWYLIDIASGLPSNALEAFMKGEHVCRHSERTWNSVFMDQFG